MIFYEASAKNNTNVEVAFRELGAKAVKRQMTINPATGQPSGERMQDTKKMQLEAKKKKSKDKGACAC